ncbi:flagellar basal body protein FliL [Arcobacter sp. HD9-500m-PIT-SAG03]|nr:flagellar basal body protein FliL [Arcobacter sp. HD9-500m-PIT-SAG03]
MADEETKEVAPQKSGKGLMIALIGIIVILIIAVGGLGFYLLSSGALNNPAPQGQETMKAEADEDAKEFFKVPINDLVLNITNAKGREKLMKLSFSLKSTEETIESIVENNKAEIIDAVIQQISARSSEELLTVGGKELLKEELLEEINIVINDATATDEDIKKNNVKKLYFTTFVIK